MPHIWVEYSANIEKEINVPQLLEAVQDALIDDGSIFPFAGARTRGVRVDNYLVVDGHPDNAFVHVLLRVASGRSEADRKAAGERVFAKVKDNLAALMTSRPLGLSVQMEESDGTVNLKTSNYRDYLRMRAAS
ncbi:5-carboxymethyl-2-hydroxymuconate isomerase [Brucella tritici]|jgi:5-carboxymethyl-2-hydroxymuconate isomerase|uniref:5-carboxymethyl-2-hydroxymuconate isomerase n=1 Tax=Brucella tritici TaxID=94626 RepID=A0A7V7VW65_9HYPH|nr:5-carboxymethyl-2-hydroxymuconate Delta-isomerase [Brucella tritici]KAB2657954.1 5-carboxymethyl-2-hydroxymuconate isomerase [Brucella tritici]